MSDAVPLGNRLRFGTMIASSSREQAMRGLESISRWGYEVLWAPDHVAFTGPVNDPLTTLAYLSALESQAHLRNQRLSAAAAPSGAGRQDGRDAGPVAGRRTFHLRRRRRRRVPARVRSLRRADQRTRRTRDRGDPGDEAAVERRARRASRQIFQLRRNQHAAHAQHSRRASGLDRRPRRWPAQARRAIRRRMDALRRHAQALRRGSGFHRQGSGARRPQN